MSRFNWNQIQTLHRRDFEKEALGEPAAEVTERSEAEATPQQLLTPHLGAAAQGPAGETDQDGPHSQHTVYGRGFKSNMHS